MGNCRIDKLIDNWLDVRFNLFFDTFSSSPISFESLHQMGLGGIYTRARIAYHIRYQEYKSIDEREKRYIRFCENTGQNFIYI